MLQENQHMVCCRSSWFAKPLRRPASSGLAPMTLCSSPLSSLRRSSRWTTCLRTQELRSSFVHHEQDERNSVLISLKPQNLNVVMDVLNFPIEILHKILLHAVISRGIQRVLRLKLVCKRFDELLQPALFESKLLDESETYPKRGSELFVLNLWQIRRTYGVEKMWHSYLLYRVKNETDPGVGRFVEIRQVAESFCSHTDAEMETMLDVVCWLAIERGSFAPGYFQAWCYSESECKPNPNLNLLSVAAYMGSIDLAKSLLQEGLCPTRDNCIFLSPMHQAALTGNSEMLRLFQEHLPDFEKTTRPVDSRQDADWRAKTGPGSINGAVMNGNMDIIRLAVYPPSRAEPDSTDFAGQPFGALDYATVPNDRGWDLYLTLYCVKTWEAFQYIDAFFSKPALSDESGSALLLARYTELANVDMVQHILDAGIDVDGGKKKQNCNPLGIAARCGHEDLVDLFLERGADPKYSRMQQNGCPLFCAAASGSLPIYRKLIDHGAFDKEICESTLDTAIQLEHTAMVKYILGLLDLSLEERRAAARRATKKGLESMALLVSGTT
ncbi:hypothetical protein VTL71DRAFT_1309 [Oculimacula yallundae]|uniref:Uncharacterized protein n=1 Tax=Oculimacula yallundae TaxID=86028 RepID=A0ABR4CAB4_9HELO